MKHKKLFDLANKMNSKAIQSIINAEAKHEYPHFVRKRILLVDDDPSFLDLLEKQLEKMGEIITLRAQGPVDAIKLMLDEKPDLVIMDLHLPKTSGLQLSKAMDQLEESLMPFIFVSADEVFLHECKGEMGEDSFYLKKPIDINLLRESLDKIFKK